MCDMGCRKRPAWWRALVLWQGQTDLAGGHGHDGLPEGRVQQGDAKARGNHGRCGEAVSYTHLDVYKRQQFGQNRLRNPYCPHPRCENILGGAGGQTAPRGWTEYRRHGIWALVVRSGQQARVEGVFRQVFAAGFGDQDLIFELDREIAAFGRDERLGAQHHAGFQDLSLIHI